MIGRLNHVAIAVRDIGKAAAVYRDMLGADGLSGRAAAGPRRDHRVHHLAEHQDRAARAARRGVADREISRAQPGRRHPPRLLRGRRHPCRPRRAQGGRARACWATASRRSARMASRCCSCIRRISPARWSSSSRRLTWADADMPVTTAVADLLSCIWWVVLFAVLPWGVRSSTRTARSAGHRSRRSRDPAAQAQAPLDDARRGADLRRLLRGLRPSSGHA